MLKSRKFVVWTVWVLLIATTVIFKVVVDPKLIDWFGYISVIYIGGNVANKLVITLAEKIIPSKDKGDE